jgi:hypothetical protein
MHDRRHDQREGGIPDGLLVGLLGFLLGLTLLAWTATGLAGVLAHGAWPTGVTFTNTPLAMRALASSPHDLPAAWPNTPEAELSGYGLFWGLAIGELMVLVVLTIFVLGTLSRWRAIRARTRAAGKPFRHSPTTPAEPRTMGDLHGRGAYAGGKGASWVDFRAPATHTEGRHQPTPDTSADGRDLPTPGTPANGRDLPTPGTPANGRDLPTPGPTPDRRDLPAPDTHADSGAAATPSAGPAGPNPLAQQGAGGWDNTPHAHVPAPRPHALLLYGDPATRRPTTLQAVLDAEGPALVVTSDPTVWAETKDARAKLGPVLVYDPGHLCDTPARLHWSPTAHCEDAARAQERAVALLAPVRPRALLDAAMADTAETLLRCWLHAAAVDGRPFKQVHRWAQNTSAHDAVRILRTHPKATAGLAGLLESALTAHPERREIARQLVVRALSALSSIHIREACTPNRADSLTLESFVNEGGTLYVVGEPIEDPRTHPGAMPLLTALASDVVEHGRRMAARSSAGRLDPPMTLVLEDVAAVAPLPRLPELLATGQDQGLSALVLLRSAEQARARWPEALNQ